MVVGVSGGVDSVCLLHLLARFGQQAGFRVIAAHLDHQLRPESSDDAAFVAQFAARIGVPVEVEQRDVKTLCAQAGWSLEDGARRIRYQVLTELAQKRGATHLAVAHTADDQAETVLMRLLRGSGLLGLSGIPVKRQLHRNLQLVRPLLYQWRSDILIYLKAHQLPFREDASNQDLSFLRNRIRHQLLPLLEQLYNPAIRRILVQLAQQSWDDYDYLRHTAGRYWKRTTKEKTGQITLSLPALRRQPKAIQRQLVREAIQRLRREGTQVEFRHWLEVERLFSQKPLTHQVDLPGGVRIRRDKTGLVCSLREQR